AMTRTKQRTNSQDNRTGHRPAQGRDSAMFTGTTMRTSTIARTATLLALALVATGLTQAASRRRDGDNSRKRGEFSIVQLRPAAGTPSGTGGTTTTSDTLRSSAAGFRQSLSLSSTTSASSYRLPSAGSNLASGHSRVWTSVSIDGENGLEASAGLAWTLK